jgi:protein tyrosine phosphatase
MVNKCDDLKDLEKGMLLKNIAKEIADRDADMEYRLLTRMTCHKIHYRSIFKSQNRDFKDKNRYQEVLPFEHSMVKL